MIWLYADTGDALRVADLASGIFWLVLPSLVLFIALPLLLRAGQRRGIAGTELDAAARERDVLVEPGVEAEEAPQVVQDERGW